MAKPSMNTLDPSQILFCAIMMMVTTMKIMTIIMPTPSVANLYFSRILNGTQKYDYDYLEICLLVQFI